MNQLTLFKESQSADKDDYSTWPGRHVYFLYPKSAPMVDTWLTARRVVEIATIEKFNAKGKRVGTEKHAKLWNSIGSVAMPLNDVVLSRVVSKTNAIESIRDVLAGEFRGNRQEYEVILNEIEMADNPAIFG